MDSIGIDAITFDCYGTLVDWESGILAALRPLLDRHGVAWDDEAILEAFARHEADHEAGPYRSYRETLAAVVDSLAGDAGFVASERERSALADSLPDWPLFDDTREALRRLGSRFRLGVLSNVDDDLFAKTHRRLGVEMDCVVTAQQVGSYKPSPRNFQALLGRLALPPERVLHAAQSLYHDIGPGRAAGLRSVWVDRRGGRAGGGATLPVDAAPDWTVPDVAALADRLLGPAAG